GAKLSGGERQRLCVARAFLKDAPILILDEPTSAIDSKTEAVILEALDRLMVGRTSFMIAHRLSTVHHADLMLVLDQGRLVQLGTPDELLLDEHDDGCLTAARYIERILRRFDLHQNWAYDARNAVGEVYGMTKGELHALYRSAELIINLHGGTVPLPEHSQTGRLIYLG